MTRIERICEKLRSAFPDAQLELEDESHLHAGHAGAQTGRGHFRLRIVSSAFAATAPLARHRAVYAALGEMMQTDIHALSIRALAPSELG